MSILIKGIDIPEDIDELRLIINGTSIAIEPTKAIQIPTPHGRLIDGDKIEAEAEQTLYGEISYEDIANAPTILEAEECPLQPLEDTEQTKKILIEKE